MFAGQILAFPLRLSPLLLLLFGAGQRCFATHSLLVFLIDGFRYDYIDDLHALPGFRELVTNGVKVDYMTPDFPSLSYPNYYSLMTGRLSGCLPVCLLACPPARLPACVSVHLFIYH